jgi:hypothetical protein
LLILFRIPTSAQSAFGTWKMNPARSVFIGDPHPRALTVRFGPHPKGEVFMWDKIGGKGTAETFSIILYFDGRNHEFQVDTCAGTSFQSSRRLDNGAVEILLTCGNGNYARFVRPAPPNARELILDVTDELPDGRRFLRHLVFEKQGSAK